MQYMLSIYNDERAWTEARPEEAAENMRAYGVFGEEAGNKIVAGAGLQPIATATTVRVAGGERLLTDGPFAETKEQLGGFYVLECESLDEALEWAAKVPEVNLGGSVEVRPVLDYEAIKAAGAETHEQAVSGGRTS